VPSFLFRCPNTGYRVQGFIAEDVSDDLKSYQAITCLVCQRTHLVNRRRARFWARPTNNLGRGKIDSTSRPRMSIFGSSLLRFA
jgi:hypothetical protein